MAISRQVSIPRRDFLTTAVGSMALVGAGVALRPLIGSLNPDASVLAARYVTVDISEIEVGTGKTFRLRDLASIEVRHRTKLQIQHEQVSPFDYAHDPHSRNANASRRDASDANRTVSGLGQFVIVFPVCTFKGCKLLSGGGDFGGWFCPCCGSRYDTAGRIRYGPAPENLAIPRHTVVGAQEVELEFGNL